MRRAALLAVGLICLLSRGYSAQQAAPVAIPSDPSRVDFVRDVRPILERRCYDCHGPDKQMNGFRLDRRQAAMRGGTLPVITPGSAASSRLYLRLVGTSYGRRMPFDDEPLPDEDVATLRRWIDQGAPWPDAASGDVVAAPLDPQGVAAFAALRGGDRAGFLAAIAGTDRLSTLRGPGGATPLMAAALHGDAALVRALLDRGADPNIANDAGATPLMWALTDAQKTRLLVERGAAVRAQSMDGRSPIVIAASMRGNLDVVTLLLDKGASPSAQAPGLTGPVTPLAEAAKQGDAAMIRLLIDRGADVARAGFTPLAMALRAGCTDCADAIFAKLPPALVSPAMVLDSAPRGLSLGAVALLARGADPHARNPLGYPMIVLAAASDAQPVDAVKALLARGADLNATGPDGETALDAARRHGRTAVVDALIAAGAKGSPPSRPLLTFSRAASPRAAVQRSLPMLQRADAGFMDTAGCVSCHNNSQTAETIALARSRGLAVDETIARRQYARIAAFAEEWRERALLAQGIPGDSDSMASLLNGLAAERHPADPTTDALARFIRLQQTAAGHWRAFAHRPPIGSGDVKTTVESMRVLQAYGAPWERAETARALSSAAAWLARVRPDGTQERVYHVMGLHAARAGKTAVSAAAQRLLAHQRADGGWSQLRTLESDAYATGQALVALLETGALRASDPAVQRGVGFLLKTQLADGTWFVARRAIPLQPYFDAGFPHGKDQFISAAATNWATQALILASRAGT